MQDADEPVRNDRGQGELPHIVELLRQRLSGTTAMVFGRSAWRPASRGFSDELAYQARNDSAAFGALIDARADEIWRQCDDVVAFEDDAERLFFALLLATGEVGLAALRLLLDDDPEIAVLFGENVREHVASALRAELRRAPIGG